MIEHIVFALLFFLPAGLANGAPMVAARLPFVSRLNNPVSPRWLGKNKTWRGLVAGIVAGALAAPLVAVLAGSDGMLVVLLPDVAQPIYGQAKPALLGAALGFGAVAGDAVESFLKRRNGIKPGDKWFPFDQIDYIAGGLLFSLPFIRLDALWYLYIVLIWFSMHLLFSYFGYLLGWKDQPL